MADRVAFVLLVTSTAAAVAWAVFAKDPIWAAAPGVIGFVAFLWLLTGSERLPWGKGIQGMDGDSPLAA